MPRPPDARSVRIPPKSLRQVVLSPRPGVFVMVEVYNPHPFEIMPVVRMSDLPPLVDEKSDTG